MLQCSQNSSVHAYTHIPSDTMEHHDEEPGYSGSGTERSSPVTRGEQYSEGEGEHSDGHSQYSEGEGEYSDGHSQYSEHDGPQDAAVTCWASCSEDTSSNDRSQYQYNEFDGPEDDENLYFDSYSEDSNSDRNHGNYEADYANPATESKPAARPMSEEQIKYEIENLVTKLPHNLWPRGPDDELLMRQIVKLAIQLLDCGEEEEEEERACGSMSCRNCMQPAAVSENYKGMNPLCWDCRVKSRYNNNNHGDSPQAEAEANDH